MSFVFALAASFFYGFAALRQWFTITGKQSANRAVVLIATCVGALLHLGHIGLTNFSQPQINFELFAIGSLISLTIVLLLLFSSWRKPIDSLFIGLLPMAAVVLLADALNDHHAPLENISYGMVWHILLSILAYSVLTIAAVQSVLLYLQDSALKKRQTTGFIQALPPLQLMDSLLFEMIWLGMILLTASYALGWPYIFDLKEQHLGHKVVFAIISWLIFAWLLFGRYRFGWRGVIASRWTLIGTAFMILSYFGSKFVWEVLLKQV